jgi:translation initiation factor IF-1
MTEDDAKNNKKEVAGSVVEALPDALFRVDLGESNIVLAYLSGKMRINHIRILVGDKVRLVLDPYGGKARITRRL